MFTTHQVLRLLGEGNPEGHVTEGVVRHALRRGDLPRPTILSGRFIWSQADVLHLADALGLRRPVLADDLAEVRCER